MARIPHELILQQQITTSETFIGFLLFICFLSILIFVVDSNGSTITIQHSHLFCTTDLNGIDKKELFLRGLQKSYVRMTVAIVHLSGTLLNIGGGTTEWICTEQ